MIYEQFQRGMNLGGWLSQYDCLESAPQNRGQMRKHLEHYIMEENIAQIASWGIDHVRVPVDYRVLTETEESLTDLETAFACIDRCLNWCEKYHLNMILDLHNAEGNIYGMMDAPMPLLKEKVLQQKFIDLWRMLTNYFCGRKKPVLMFELLNEVSDGSGYLWNRLYLRTVEAIREIDPSRYILVGSNEQNSPFRLKELELLDDPGVFYNFHFYDPQVFTHQRASFSEEMGMFDRTIHYPDDISDFTAFLQKNRKFLPKYAHVVMEHEVSKEAMKLLLKDAIDFAMYSGKELYCGEFGVINTAEPEDAAGWICDVQNIFDEYRIGSAFWNYKELDFGFVDRENKICSRRKVESIIPKRTENA